MTADPEADSSARHELDRSLVVGVAWSGAASWTAQAVTWLCTLVVARLVSPADYGIVGLAWLYLGLVAMTAEFGIGSAVVTLRHLSAQHLRQLNTLAVALGVFACGLTLCLARPLAWFFEEPRLPAAVAVLSLSALFSGFRVVPAAILQKELRFRRLAAYDATQSMAAALATLSLAAAGWGYWALVVGSLLGALVHMLLMVHARPQGMAWPRGSEIAPAVVFSRSVLGSRLSWYAYDNADSLVAGKLLGTVPLGAYRLAWTFAGMPLGKLVSLVSRVAPAVLSAVQHEPAELRRYVLGITETISLVVFPIGVGLALVADDFVHVLLGDKWLAAVAPLRILAVYACVRGLSPLWTQVLMVTGDASYLMRVTTLGAVFLPIGFVVGSHWGLAGIAYAWVFVHPPVVVAPIFSRLRRRIELKYSEYARALAPAAVSTLLMAVAVGLARLAAPAASPVPRLASTVAVGAVAYAAAMVTFGRGRLRSLARLLSKAFATAK
jgi:polysaccharide transporter, PST family